VSNSVRSSVSKLLFLALLVPALACADEVLDGYCSQTATLVLQTGGLTSSPPAAGVYPGCTVTVYFAGTTTIAPIFRDNNGTALANPFQANTTTGAWQFYAANGRYDVNLSGGTPSLPAPFTIFDNLLFDLPGILTTSGCLFTASPGSISVYAGCLPGGVNGSVQYNSFGVLGGDQNFAWNAIGQFLNINGLSSNSVALIVSNAGISTAGGVISSLGAINSFTGVSDGADLAAVLISQNVAVTKGGYLHLTPVTYNPYNEPGVCKDQYGNAVQQPIQLPGDTFGTNDAVMWLGTSPLLPSSPTAACPTPGGPPLPLQETWGLNLNTYLLAMEGLATTSSAFNSIESFSGGAYVNLAYTTNYGLIVNGNGNCAFFSPLTGPNSTFGGIGYAGSGNYCVWNGVQWVSSTLLGGGGGGGSPSPPTGGLQYYSGGVFAATSNLTWNAGSQLLNIVGTSPTAPTLSVSGYGSATGGWTSGACTSFNCIQAPAGGIYAGLGITAQLAFYPLGQTCTGIPAVSAGYGGWGFQSGTTYCYWNATGSAWQTVNLASVSGSSPGGALNYVQYYGAGAVFAGNSGFQFIPSTQQVAITGVSSSQAALSVHTGYIETQYGLVEDLVNTYNAVNLVGSTGGCTATTPCSGGLARSWRATTYTGTGNFSTSLGVGPATTTGDTFADGDVSYSEASSCEAFYTVASGWNCITGSATAIAAGSPPQVQFNNGGSPNVLGASPAFTYNSTNSLLTLGQPGGSTVLTLSVAGVTSSAGGFVSTCMFLNCFNDPTGGITTLNATFGGQSGSTGPINIALVGTSGPGAGTSHRTAIAFETAGGATSWLMGADLTEMGDRTWFMLSPSAPAPSIEGDYTSGHIGIGGPPLTATGQWLYVHGSTGVAAVAVLSGYVQADGGFLSGSLAQGSIQTAGGFNADDLGTSLVPALSINSVASISFSNQFVGAAVNLASGGTYSINGAQVINSSLQFVGNAVNLTPGGTYSVNGSQVINSSLQFVGNAVNLASGGTYSISSTQVINSSLQFVGTAVNVSGVIQSQATGASIAFQTSSPFNFQVNGNGVVSAAGGLAVGGSAVINSSGAFVGTSINTAGSITTTNTTTGIVTTSGSNSTIYVGNGATGNFYNRFLSGPSTAVSCSGVNTGWMAISTDNYVVVCISGARYRSALTSF
jgi:hypothetical protein